MTALVEMKKYLYDNKRTFHVALRADDEAVVNSYILGVYNTLVTHSELQKCTPESIRDAAITSATLGVPIDGRQYAYLVPYKGHVQFQLSYKGYVYLAKRDPDVDQIQSVIVYEEDDFSVDMGDNTITHIPNLDSQTYGQDSAIKYVYAIVRFKENTGRHRIFEVMTRKAIDDIRDNAKQDYIWSRHYGEMARKTVIKRLCKHAQLGDSHNIEVVDNAVDQGKIVNITPDGVIEAEDFLAEDAKKIIAAIEGCEEHDALEEINEQYRDQIEEIICYDSKLSKKIKSVWNKKSNELYSYKLQRAFEACTDLASLDKVYSAHEARIGTLPAKERNVLIEYYCVCKEGLK